jgi:hypothetical protein
MAVRMEGLLQASKLGARLKARQIICDEADLKSITNQKSKTGKACQRHDHF